jgi:hypothetical protein
MGPSQSSLYKPGGASATPSSQKNPVFDFAVALCVEQGLVS